MSRRDIERATGICMVYVQNPLWPVRYDWSVTARREESRQ